MKKSNINLQNIIKSINTFNIGDGVCAGDIACGGNWAMC